MAGGKDEKEKLAPIIIKRVKKGGGGHHGGAWKVAYADFVTAMMAFFLLLWLLNVTTEDQKNAISNYFDPSHPRISDSVSGAGGIMGGMTMSPDGAMVSTVQPLAPPENPDVTTRGEHSGDAGTADPTEEELAKELRKKEDERFNVAADKLKKEIASSAELKELQKNLLIDITPEGMRIQIVDDKGRSMFPSGSAQMFDFMRQLLIKVTGVVTPLPNQVSVRGHTDSNRYKDPSTYDNWNLSADRAQASRRVMAQAGLPEKRIENVMGRADREHLDIKEPASPRNRRISIILLRERLTKDQIEKLKAVAKTSSPAAAVAKMNDVPSADKLAPLEIVDDTKPESAAQAEKTAKPVKPDEPAEYLNPQNRMNLPVTEGPATTIRRQPQVMVFDSDGTAPAPANDSLYEGPQQSPFTVPETNKPPTIKTPLFNLPSDKEEKAEPLARTPNASEKPAATSPVKVLTFGDPVPPPSAPLAPAPLPPAPGLQLNNSGAAPAPTLNSRILNFGDEATDSAAPTVQPATPAPAQARPKELTF